MNQELQAAKAILVGAAILAANFAAADTITLKNGIVAHGTIVKAEERGIRVEYSEDKIVYHRREEIADVQRDNDPVLAQVAALRKKGDLAKAETALLRAIEVQPVGWLAERYRLELMECQQAHGRFADAVETYLAMMRANPESWHYARMPLPIGGPDENKIALQCLENSMAEAPARRPGGQVFPLQWTLMGGILAADGKAADAEVYLKLLSSVHDERSSALARLLSAEVALANKKGRDAAELLDKNLRTLPEELKPLAYYLLGAAYAQCGEPKLAATAFLRIPLGDFSESVALQSECLFQGAAECEKAGLKDQAAALRRELAEKFPGSYRAKSASPKENVDK